MRLFAFSATLALLLTGVTLPAPAQVVYNGTFAVSSQAYLDTFTNIFGAIEIVTGSLIIGHTDFDSDIDDLSNLGSIQQVGGVVIVRNNPRLKHLHGLDSLETVQGPYLEIVHNDSLLDLQGLEQLSNLGASSGGYLRIGWNNLLHSLQGLSGLTHIKEFLLLTGNPSLSSLEGLSSLLSVQKWLSVYNCDALSNLTGLDNLHTIGGNLKLEENEQLQDLSGLGALETTGGLILRNNPLLNSLDALGGIAVNGEYMEVDNNPQLSSLDGLENTTHCDWLLDIRNNAALENLNGLANLQSVAQTLRIINNGALTQIGLPNLKKVGDGGVSLLDNDALVGLDSLYALDTIMGVLAIDSNASLLNINGIDSLEYCSSFELINNQKLQEVIGFAKLGLGTTTGIGRFNISHNDSLSIVSGFSNLLELGRDFSISNNPSLLSVHGFENFEQTYRGVGFSQNAVLQEISGFHRLKSVGNTDPLSHAGIIYIGNNGQLFSVSGFDSLVNITEYLGFQNLPSLKQTPSFALLKQIGYEPSQYGSLYIENNVALDTLAGFQNLDLINRTLKVSGNTSLVDCSALCHILEHTEIGMDIIIEGNAGPCSSVDSVEVSCDTSSVVQPVEDLPLPAGAAWSVYPNPASSHLTWEAREPINAELEIVSPLGTVVWRQGTAGEKSVTIPVAQLPSGAYLLRVQAAGRPATALNFMKK